MKNVILVLSLLTIIGCANPFKVSVPSPSGSIKSHQQTPEEIALSIGAIVGIAEILAGGIWMLITKDLTKGLPWILLGAATWAVMDLLQTYEKPILWTTGALFLAVGAWEIYRHRAQLLSEIQSIKSGLPQIL